MSSPRDSRARRVPVTYLVAAGTALLLVLLAWVGRDRFQPVIVGTAAPAFAYPDLDGLEVALADHAGGVVLVNVWATWCPPCRAEMPSMQRLYEDLADEDFEILAVSVDAPAGQVDALGRPGGDLRAFAEEFALTFPILHNPSGDIQRMYQTTGVPESFLIGPDGLIRRKVAGPMEWDTPAIREQIQRILADR